MVHWLWSAVLTVDASLPNELPQGLDTGVGEGVHAFLAASSSAFPSCAHFSPARAS